jgi:hemerythrin
MAFIEWNSAFESGIPSVDSQHKRLVGMINGMHKAIVERRGREILGSILNQMRTYTLTHFKAEERLMADYGYPELAGHQDLHAYFVARVDSFQEDFSAGKPVLTREVMGFLKEWLETHILKADRGFSDYLREKGLLEDAD